MIKICRYAAAFYWIFSMASSQKCFDPLTSKPTKPGSAQLHTDGPSDSNQSNTIVFPHARVYTLSESPLVQYALVGTTEDDVLMLKLKEPYKKRPTGYRWHTDFSATLEFGDFQGSVKNGTMAKEFLKRHGTSKNKALVQMSNHCEFLVLQECFENVVRFLMIAAISVLCYAIYSLFDFVVNYFTLMKTGGRTRTIMSLFYAMSQAVTGRRIATHHQKAIEKVHFDLHVKITELEEQIKVLEEKQRHFKVLGQNNKNLADYNYDYIQLVDRKKISSDGEENLGYTKVLMRHPRNKICNDNNNQNSDGYLSPINYTLNSKLI